MSVNHIFCAISRQKLQCWSLWMGLLKGQPSWP